MKKIGLTAALLGLTGVALGAFGAHGLQERLAASGLQRAWDTAVIYHLLHVLALLAVAQAAPPRPLLRVVAACWAAGVILFSGSLYLLALGGPRGLGPITPFGGVCFLIGWLLLAWSYLRPANAR